jgi:hypothetical protein
VERLDLLLSGQ